MIEVICAKCGKKFIPAPQHAYRDEKGFYCSWTCFNHRKDKDKIKGRGKSRSMFAKRVLMCDRNGLILREFTSALNAAEYLGYCAKCIRDACRESKIYRGYLWKYEE